MTRDELVEALARYADHVHDVHARLADGVIDAETLNVFNASRLPVIKCVVEHPDPRRPRG